MERNIEGYTNYHITNDGRVYSFNQNKWKKIHIHRGRVRERGELSVASKLTNRQRRRILRMLDKGVKQIHLANRFGVHRKTLEHLRKKRAWYGL